MKVMKAEDVRKLDYEASQAGISTLVLMQRAADALYHHVKKRAQQDIQRVTILCGPGNNGGDGFALALLLRQDRCFDVDVYCFLDLTQMSQDERYYARSCRNENVTVLQKMPESLQEYDMIVDCLFGTGLDRPITGKYAELIDLVNQSDAYVLACDIPSGLSADHGEILGAGIQADATVSFAAGKFGLYVQEGLTHCGHTEIADIGIPQHLIDAKMGFTLLTAAAVKQMLPPRHHSAHKGTYGKALLIGGSYGMGGALLLAARAALRCGVGTCTLMGDERVLMSIAGMIPEAMSVPFPDELEEQIFQRFLKQYDGIAIGNGLGRGAWAKWLVEQVWNSDVPCVLDGDAFYLISQMHNLKKRKAKTVFTPHPKEVSYLLGTEIQDVVKKPVEALFRLLKQYPGVCMVMKGAKTLLSDGEGHWINVIGNDGLATGGSGDTLCGMILSFLTQGANPLDAAACGVYLHAACADALLAYETTYSILPSDLIMILPKLLKQVLDE